MFFCFDQIFTCAASFCGSSAIRECFTWDVVSPPNSGLTLPRGCFQTSSGSCQCSFLLGLAVTNISTANATITVFGQAVDSGSCPQFVIGTPLYTFSYFPQNNMTNVTTVVQSSPVLYTGPLAAGYYGVVVTDSRGLTNTACFLVN